MSLSSYIQENHGGNAADFGRTMGVDRNAVYRWISKGYVVLNNKLYAPIRALNV